MKKTSVPTRDQWQGAIDEFDFDFVLDSELNPTKDSGYCPCRLSGTDSGFELYFDDSEDLLRDFAALAPGCDCALLFCWGGDMSECASAVIACLALAKRFNALISYEGDLPETDLARMETEARTIVDDALRGE